jgi:CheY-like chemotaxis protein
MLLIVEDERDVRAVLLELLTLNGHTGIAASNGREALQLLKTRSTLPQVILLDMIMPVLMAGDFSLNEARTRGSP